MSEAFASAWLGAKLIRRTSAGSFPRCRARASTARSSTYVASGRPAPRTASVGVMFVMTPVNSYQ